MPAVDTTGALRAVTKLLVTRLGTALGGATVEAGHPEKAASAAGPKVNLFLYEIERNEMGNVVLDPTQPSPLWLTLKFLMTAFDVDKESDTMQAHLVLGRGIAALHSLNFLEFNSATDPDLEPLDIIPDRLKVSFDSAGPELISKVMQGTTDKFRLCVAFQVRPVLILPPPSQEYPLRVGIDYTQGGATLGHGGRDGIRSGISASLGARPRSLDREAFEPGDLIHLQGEDLQLDHLEALLGSVPVQIVGQRPDQLTLRIVGSPSSGGTDTISDGSTLSAGHHPLVLRERLVSGRYRSSAPLAARLLPVVTGAAAPAGYPGPLVVTGRLLGTAMDDIQVILWKDGLAQKVYDAPASAADQSSLTIQLDHPSSTASPPPAGTYLVMIQVNGQQAFASPTVNIV